MPSLGLGLSIAKSRKVAAAVVDYSVVCPPGDTAITIPPGTWTFGTAFWGSTIANNDEIFQGGSGFVYFDGAWYHLGDFSPATDTSISGNWTYRNNGAGNVTLWVGSPP